MVNNNDKIDSTILLSSNAEVVEQFDMLRHVAISRWSIDRNSVNYQKDDSHTLSLYVSGGETSYRADQAGNKGSPGKLCLMPQGHYSDWHINGKIHFIHLYFADKILKQFAASHYDCDVRAIDLQDITYSDDYKLRELLVRYIRQCSSRRDVSPLFAEETLYEIFQHLIATYNGFHLKDCTVKGGLTPLHMGQVKAAVHDHLHTKLSIAQLAKIPGLSPYHFARMFKLSFGEAPAQFITRTRIEKVRQLLKTNLSLAEISGHTGFSQQSHMTEHFRKITGLTPAAYRKDFASLAA